MGRRSAVKRVVRSLWQAYLRWCRYDCVDLSAAFAYYTLQSIFPLLLIVLCALRVPCVVRDEGDPRPHEGCESRDASRDLDRDCLLAG